MANTKPTDDDVWSAIIDATTEAVTYAPWIIVLAKYMRGDKLNLTDYASLLPSVLFYMGKRSSV